MEDDEARRALTLFEHATSTDKRLVALQSLDAYLEHSSEVTHFDELAEALRLQLKHANPLVSSKALSVVPSLLEKLTNHGGGTTGQLTSISNQHVRLAVQTFIALLFEKLGDHREKTREGAKKALIQLAKVASAASPAQAAQTAKRHGTDDSAMGVYERLFVEAGLQSKVAKVREHAILLLMTLRSSLPRLPLRPFLQTLVEHLLDADVGVREASSSTIIALFAGAPPTAKADLKREIERKNVRKQTADTILGHVFGIDDTNAGNGVSETPTDREIHLSGPSVSTTSRQQAKISSTALDEPSVSSRSASRLGGGTGSAEAANVRLVYIASSSEVERTFAAMLPHFTGKETEHNWQAREQHILKIRGMLKTSTHDSFPAAFNGGIHKLADGIIKAAGSLRTTLSMQGVTLVSELAQHMGNDLESDAETFLTAFIRMSGLTKKIVANASQAAVGEIIKNVSFKHKYLDLVAQSLPDKNPPVRMAMCQHLITILATHGKHRRHALESHGGLEMMTKSCRVALADANKDVRALAREVFYRVEEIWPAVGRSILESLDTGLQKQVESNRSSRNVLATAVTQPVQKSFETTSTPAAAHSRTSGNRTAILRTPGTPGGPSSALVAAKRAAAAAMAKERREREEAEARAADAAKGQNEDEEGEEDLMNTLEVQEEEMEEQRRLSPSPPARVRSRSPPASPSTSALRSPHRRQTPLSVPPSSIPLPTSSPSGSINGSTSRRLPDSVPGSRSRTTSTSSVSSNRSTGARFGAASAVDRYGSIAQRFDQSPSQAASAAREQRRSMAMAQTTFSSPSIKSDQSAMRVSEHDTNRPAEDTISPFSLSSSQKMNKLAPLSASRNRKISGSSGASVASEEAGSPSLRSRLPRPVSMLPSPKAQTAQNVTPRHSHSSSLDAADMSSGDASLTPSKQSAYPASQDEKGHAETDARPLTSDAQHPPASLLREDIPADASRATKWFLGKASRLDYAQLPTDEDTVSGLSPVKRRPESEDYIAQLLSERASLRTFKGLVSMSKEFRLPVRPGKQDEHADHGDGSTGALGLATSAQTVEKEYKIAVRMWQEGQLFERLFDALSTYLSNATSTSVRDLHTAGLVLLHRLVENQFGLFAVQGRERELVDLLLELVKRNAMNGGSAASGVKSACQAIVDRWSDQTDVIVGISTLRSLLLPVLGVEDPGAENGPTDVQAKQNAVIILGLRSLARLFARLPSELVEEQMEPCKAVVKFGLHNRQIELRQQAVAVLVAANSTLRDPHSLFTILQPIDKAQQDLLIYYMNKK